MLKIGIIKEGKIPQDCRVPLSPEACKHIVDNFPVQIRVQTSDVRSYTDEEYRAQGIDVVDDVTDMDILMGVKEVEMDELVDGKTYFFFSHTIKMQSYNRELLQTILKKNITLLDYEVLTNKNGQRVIAFGKFAGMVGAHNALWTYGQRTQLFELKRMKDCHDYNEAKEIYNKIIWPNIKIVITGTGRVGNGAKMVLDDMGIREVSSAQFINNHDKFNEAIYCQLSPDEYVEHKNREPYIQSHFYEHPEEYQSVFGPFTQIADIMINGIYWDNEAPTFFTREDMSQSDFNIKVIADVTCDIAPVSSIPSTLKASTIADPIFGYSPITGEETAPHDDHVIDMMTIDNLPNELPRDASTAFGEQFIEFVLPELLKDKSLMIEKAAIAKNGDLGSYFEYLREYVAG